MKFRLIPAETTGTFLVNPSIQTLKEIKKEGHTLAKATCVVEDDDGLNTLYTISVSEYFDDKLIEVKTPTAENPSAYTFDTLSGPLQTKITITCPDNNEEAKKKLDKLAKHLEKGFYVSNPYVGVLGGYGRQPYMEIKEITPIFADTVWSGLQTAPEFALPAAFIAELKSRTYSRVFRAEEDAIYNNIQALIADGKHTEAVDAAYTVVNKRGEYDYLLSTTSDYLYQAGIWLKDLNLAESNRAFRLLSKLDMHCMHLLARKQLTQAATAKIANPDLYGSPRVTWSSSLVGSGLEGATAPGADQDAYVAAVQAVATKDGAIEMSGDVPGGVEYGHAVAQSLAVLKDRKFDGSSLAGTVFEGEAAGEIELGLAMMQALFQGLGAAMESQAAETPRQPSAPSSSNNGSSAKPRPAAS
jgi:hypothetical protein